MKFLGLVLSSFLVGFAAHAACAEPTPIRVGLLSSTSDTWATVGQMTVRGAEMAADEINTSGGVNGRPLVLEVQDTREASSGATAVTAYQHLRAKGVSLFVGLLGVPAARAVAPLIASDKDVVCITPSAGLADFHQSSDRAFNARGTDSASVEKLAAFALGKGWRAIAILDSAQPWESAVAQAFQSKFGETGSVVKHVTAVTDQSDFSSLALQIVRAAPDAVFLSNYNTVAAAARSLRQLGYQGQLLAINLDPSRLVGAFGGLEGALFVSIASPGSRFQERFKLRYGMLPLQTADWAYDAVLLLAAGLKRASDPSASAVARSLAAVSVQGANGPVSFGPGRCVARAVELWQVDGEQFTKIRDL